MSNGDNLGGEFHVSFDRYYLLPPPCTSPKPEIGELLWEFDANLEIYDMERIVRRSKKRKTATFAAHTEDGHQVTIHEITEFLEVGTPDETSGLAELLTDDGRPVNRIEKGKYQLVATGEILTSDDPNAF